MNHFIIRQVNDKDIPFLWDMLHEAIFVPEGEERPAKPIVRRPEIAKYVDGWGRPGDKGFIAETADRVPAGAVWIRLFDETNKGYGFIDEQTPELSMAVAPEYRGKGAGSALLAAMLTEAKTLVYSAVSLSVDPRNPAVRLYERHGFVKAGNEGTSWVMKADL